MGYLILILRRAEAIVFNPKLGEDKRVYTFPKGISPKVNVIAQLEFELAYFEAAVQRYSHYAIRVNRVIYVCMCM